MKQQVMFVHGGHACGTREEYVDNLKTTPIKDVFTDPVLRWSQTLRSLLGGEYEVAMPLMPNKYDAKYEDWKIWFERYFEFFNDNVILVGHSLGGIFLAKYLSENQMPLKIKSVHLVAAVATYEGRRDTGITSFSFDFKLLTNLEKQVENIHIYHSKDDFVVPYEHALRYKEALPLATLHTFEDRNHFLQEEFPELVAEIKKV